MAEIRTGTTSYILPAEILPNVRYLASRVQDVELVLFDIDSEHGSLPDTSVIEQLADLKDSHDLSFTVHMPLDLHLGATGHRSKISLEKARRVVERTRSLDPLAYIIHLVREESADYDDWVQRVNDSLERMIKWAGIPSRIAIENLEGYPLDFLDPVLDSLAVSRCVDIGHLWLDGHDPIEFLEMHIARTRVIHIHGISSRDHQSLMHVRAESLEDIIDFLLTNSYRGVLTIEVFNLPDLESSLRALKEAGLPWRES